MRAFALWSGWLAFAICLCVLATYGFGDRHDPDCHKPETCCCKPVAGKPCMCSPHRECTCAAAESVTSCNCKPANECVCKPSKECSCGPQPACKWDGERIAKIDRDLDAIQKRINAIDVMRK